MDQTQIDYNHIDETYAGIVKNCLYSGKRKPNRTGVDTISTFNYNYEVDLRKGFPLLTTKEISWKNIVVEMLWFLSGETDIRILQERGCKFWDAWADKDGKVPSAYGNFWRKFPVEGPKRSYVDDGCMGPQECYIPTLTFNDQIKFVVDELKRNPMSRRLVVSAWAPGNAQTSKLPPCHCMFIFNVQLDEQNKPYLCCHLTQRSCDIALGVPYNIASYALLTEIISNMVNIPVGIFAHTLVDSHIYTCKEDGSMKEYDHLPGLVQQITRESFPMPRLTIRDYLKLEDFKTICELPTGEILEIFELSGYKAHPNVKFKVAV